MTSCYAQILILFTCIRSRLWDHLKRPLVFNLFSRRSVKSGLVKSLYALRECILRNFFEDVSLIYICIYERDMLSLFKHISHIYAWLLIWLDRLVVVIWYINDVWYLNPVEKIVSTGRRIKLIMMEYFEPETELKKQDWKLKNWHQH